MSSPAVLKSIQQSCRGIALIIVMVSILVLATLAGGFAYSMKIETKLARNANSETELEWLGRSGVELARWYYSEVLKLPPGPTLLPGWGRLVAPGFTNSPLENFDLNATYSLGNGTFRIEKITEVNSKFNINYADQNILQRAFGVMGVGPGDSSGLIASILDWKDPDRQVTPGGGAESNYYKDLDQPYLAKDGPIDDLSEMLLINGIRDKPEIYGGPSFRGQTGSKVPPIPLRCGLKDIFTTLSLSGKVNINTASPDVLQLLPMIDVNFAFQIISNRNIAPFRNAGELVNVVPPPMVQALLPYVDVISQTIEVRVHAEVSGSSRRFVAVIDAKPAPDGGPQVLTFYWQ